MSAQTQENAINSGKLTRALIYCDLLPVAALCDAGELVQAAG
jgi:hypothetical protein